jgi:hypothetical protein
MKPLEFSRSGNEKSRFFIHAIRFTDNLEQENVIKYSADMPSLHYECEYETTIL